MLLDLSVLYPVIRLYKEICDHQPSQSVVGVCLEGDTTLRLETTVALFRTKTIHHVIVSGGVAEDKTRDELPAKKMKDVLTIKGIPPEAIDIEEKSLTTHEHPLYVFDIAQKRRLKELMLITSRHHFVRAYLRFLRVILDQNLPILLYGYPAGSFVSLFHRVPTQGHYRINIFLEELTKMRTYSGLASFDEAFSYLQSRK